MNEIKCPKCGTIFKIDESDYESILKQIRNNTVGYTEINALRDLTSTIKENSLIASRV